MVCVLIIEIFLIQVDRWLIWLMCDAYQNPALKIKDTE